MDSMRAIRIHHEPCFLRERDGAPEILPALKSANQSRHARACARAQYLDYYFVIRAACSIAKEINDAPPETLCQ